MSTAAVPDRAAAVVETTSFDWVDASAIGGNANTDLDLDISADGRFVAFSTSADNIVPDDTNNGRDVFVHDRQTRVTERVSVATDGSEANGASKNPSLSADGRFVAFESVASDLVVGDTNGFADAFVHDRETGVTSIVAGLTRGNDESGAPSISDDGRYVAFQSLATNLVPNDTNNVRDIFVLDTVFGVMERVSERSSGIFIIQANDASFAPSIDGSGQFVAFESDATNLTAADTNATRDIFVHARRNRAVTRVSVSTAGAQANAISFAPSISDGGDVIAYESIASNLVAGDTNGASDVFVRDIAAGTTSRVSVGGVPPAIVQANGTSGAAVVSGDGRYVGFSSFASNLDPGDTNGTADGFVHDRSTGITELVTLGFDGSVGNSVTGGLRISDDADTVAFTSLATNLVPDDVEGHVDAFARQRSTVRTERVSIRGPDLGSQSGQTSSISADGNIVAFATRKDFIVNGDSVHDDVFVRNRLDGTLRLVSVGLGGAPTTGNSRSPRVSGNGRFLAFTSAADNLVPGDINGAQDVFVHDLSTLVTSRVSIDSAGAEANAGSTLAAISTDGRFVAFQSVASNLVAGDTNSTQDVFVHDRGTGATELISVDRFGGPADGFSSVSDISGDGRYVLFVSQATDIVASDTNSEPDVFRRDRQLGTTQRVNLTASGAQSSGFVLDASMSGDGEIVAFSSFASDLVDGDTNGAPDVFVRDTGAGTTVLASTGLGGAPADNRSDALSVSADGRFVVFESDASNLVLDDTNDRSDVFVYDVALGDLDVVSRGPSGDTGDLLSFNPEISADGAAVVFGTFAGNLVPTSYFETRYLVAQLSAPQAFCDGQPATITGSGVIDGTGGPDVIVGSTGDDTITGFGGDDLICGLAGNDMITDFAGNDRILGGSGNDRITSGNGDDMLIGGPGDDVLKGENGNDVLHGDEGDDDLVGGGNNDRLVGGPGDDRFRGGPGVDTADYSGSPGPVRASINDTADDGTGLEADNVTTSIETVVGSDFDDVLVGSQITDTLIGGPGHDRLVGRSGDDLLDGGDDDDLLLGGAGDDDLEGGGDDDRCLGAAGNNGFNECEDDDTNPPGPGPAEGHPALCDGLVPTITGAGVINGTGGDDIILGSPGPDTITGFGGNDILCGGEGNDLLIDFSGNDRLLGGDGNDRLLAGSGDDTLIGGSGHDVLKGENGNDTLQGDHGNDDLVGGSDDDTMVGGPGDDRFRGGPGQDTADYTGSTSGVFVFRGSGADDGAGQEADDVQTSVEVFLGSAHGDSFIGANVADIAFGNGGDDRLAGRGGNDTLNGGDGDDFVLGGADDDILNGDADNDRCIGAAGTDLTSNCETDQP